MKCFVLSSTSAHRTTDSGDLSQVTVHLQISDGIYLKRFLTFLFTLLTLEELGGLYNALWVSKSGSDLETFVPVFW